MTRNKLFLALAALVGGLMLAPTQAAAAEARTPLNVRTGPGTSFAAFDVLARGEHVEILRTRGGWCYVQKSGRDGWVSCNYLRDDDRGRDDRSDRPEVDIEFSIPGFSFSIGGGDFDIDFPDRDRRRGRVCFYEHFDYEGDRFCARPGERIRSLGEWNDRISSIRVRGDAEAQVCVHNNFNGRCVIVDRNIRSIGRRGNDAISSIRVR